MTTSHLFLLLLFSAITCRALDNGLALTPPMGFNSWERFRCNVDCKNDPENCISEHLYISIADALVAGGYRAAGYQFVNVDDCWLSHERDTNGRLQADPDRFPHGIKWLADEIHSRGLKLGLYQDVGTHTCAGYPGMQGSEELDAQTLASWQIDYLKVDGCYANSAHFNESYPLIGRALNDTGRAIVYSCEWAVYQQKDGVPTDFGAIARTCNLCRDYNDVEDSEESIESIVDYFAERQDELAPNAAPGSWNDPDMLVVGDYGLSETQARAQFALWAILAAPLLISADVRSIEPEAARVLLNADVIAVNQDRLGRAGRRIVNQTEVTWGRGIDVFRRAIEPTAHDGRWTSAAIVVWNRRVDGMPFVFRRSLAYYGLTHGDGYYVRNLYSGEHYGLLHASDNLTVRVDPSGGVVMLRADLAIASRPIFAFLPESFRSMVRDVLNRVVAS